MIKKNRNSKNSSSLKKPYGYNVKLFFKFITGVGSLGTFIAVIITYLTLAEIRQQRIIGNKPELTIIPRVPINILAKIELKEYTSTGDSSIHQIKKGTKMDIFKGITTYTFNDKINTDHIKVNDSLSRKSFNFMRLKDWKFLNYNQLNDFQFSVYNIGNGVAKNVNLQWSFDTIKMEQEFHEKADNSIIYKGMIHSRGQIFIATPKDTVKLLSNDIKDIKAFILSGDKDRNKMEFKIPETYIKLWSLRVAIIYFSNSMMYQSIIMSPTIMKDHEGLYPFHNIDENLESLWPWLYLKVTYMDINENHYEKKFKIIIDEGLAYLRWYDLYAADRAFVYFEEVSDTKN